MGDEQDPARMSATELVRRYRALELSPVEATAAALAAIDAHDHALNAFAYVAREEALEAARQSEARWRQGRPLGAVDGVPTTIKDIITVEGWPTGKGSLSTRGQLPDGADAPVTRNLRRAGAVLIGKTTTPEFGWKAVTDSPATGITRNPWNPARTSGGSSGGAAVAAATGMGALHVGTDGGGSIRIPASFTGIFGLKPTFGRVPAYPLSPFGSLAHLGPMTRSAGDAELMLQVLCEADCRDWLAVQPELLAGPDRGRDWKGLRVGYLSDLPGVPVDAEVAGVVQRTLEIIEALGGAVEPVRLAHLDPRESFRYHWYTGAYQLSRLLPKESVELLDPGLRAIIEEARGFTLDAYLDAAAQRGAIGTAVQQLYERHDVLVSPSVPVKPLTAGEEVANPATQCRWIDWARYSYLFNLSQQPAASLPCGFTPDGCPVGLQIAGPRFADYRLLALCVALERELGTFLPG